MINVMREINDIFEKHRTTDKASMHGQQQNFDLQSNLRHR